jgi:hypothetical protein
MKTLSFHRVSTPDVSGYPDLVIINEEQGQEIGRYSCSTNPNPFRPSDHAKWQDAYGQVAAPLKTTFTCITSQKHGKCLAVNDCKPIPTTNPDVNDNGNYLACEVEVHCGSSDTWRGSAACFTIYPPVWNDFIAKFAMGETGILILT